MFRRSRPGYATPWAERSFHLDDVLIGWAEASDECLLVLRPAEHTGLPEETQLATVGPQRNATPTRGMDSIRPNLP
jgi:hypothetical protein